MLFQAIIKADLRVKFIAIQSYLKNQEKSQKNNLNLHLKQSEKEEQILKAAREKQQITDRKSVV